MPAFNYIVIDNERINNTCDAYFKWKDLDTSVKRISTRGINMPDVISEPMACYCLGLVWNRGSKSGDATNLETGEKIEFKATSRFSGDLSSFGPRCDFDKLYFLRFQLSDNLLFIYDTGLNSEQIKDIQINQTETFGEQQAQGRRPHLSILDMIIRRQHISPVCIFNIRRCEVYYQRTDKYNELAAIHLNE